MLSAGEITVRSALTGKPHPAFPSNNNNNNKGFANIWGIGSDVDVDPNSKNGAGGAVAAVGSALDSTNSSLFGVALQAAGILTLVLTLVIVRGRRRSCSNGSSSVFCFARSIRRGSGSVRGKGRRRRSTFDETEVGEASGAGSGSHNHGHVGEDETAQDWRRR